MNRILSPAKALRTLRKNPVILNAVLAGISQEQAETLRDGADGWNIVYVICHLRDYERIVGERIEAILSQDRPTLADMDNAALIARNRYAEQSLEATLADLAGLRAALIERLAGLSDEQWLRSGVHAVQGEGTVLDIAVNAGLHDIDHIEQLVRCAQPARDSAARRP
ncbi:MAG TPA: DinB family protein [Herpetosiphonaceae bacterium]|nr:DinB family protein [Herpetosiphonaceae bacterium]